MLDKRLKTKLRATNGADEYTYHSDCSCATLNIPVRVAQYASAICHYLPPTTIPIIHVPKLKTTPPPNPLPYNAPKPRISRSTRPGAATPPTSNTPAISQTQNITPPWPSHANAIKTLSRPATWNQGGSYRSLASLPPSSKFRSRPTLSAQI